MKLIEDNITQTLDEIYLVETLNLDNKTILELGCGNASMTKEIAQNGSNRKIIACEVDEVQHRKNLLLNIPNIEFKLNGAEDIDVEDESIDAIFMFKSFHHIPYDLMKKALKEIKRVLKPNGLLIILETSVPTKFPYKQGYQFHSKILLPIIGKLFSKDKVAYNYLSESASIFPYGTKLNNILQNIGFINVKNKPQTFGVATIYTATKL